jgi:hypothetical protein
VAGFWFCTHPASMLSLVRLSRPVNAVRALTATSTSAHQSRRAVERTVYRRESLALLSSSPPVFASAVIDPME